MEKNYKIWVFGKAGCDKCKVLNQRIDKLLADPQWQDFGKAYFDVETEDGLVRFCTSECINPQRIPAFVVAKKDADSGQYKALVNPTPDVKDPLCQNSRLHSLLGLQTDYNSGGGLITPKMISTILDEAASL